MVTECPVVKLRKLTDAALDAWADGGGPENAVLAELQVATASLCQEFLHLFIRGASKEKDVVKVALAGKFSLSLWQTYVLYEFSGREGESARAAQLRPSSCA